MDQKPYKEKKAVQVEFFVIQKKKKQYTFLPPDYTQIHQAVAQKIEFEKLIKMIHYKYSDQGLTYTLIHRIYQADQIDIEYYVPELVYIAVRKMCRPMKKVLIAKASSSQNLRRLILWNIKAFTVLMVEKDQNLKKFIRHFEQEIVANVSSPSKFLNSQKAIAMLSTASLVLKKMPKQQIKDKLKKFIKRYNFEILNNLDHTIMIPFRHNIYDKQINSTYVVRIVEQKCSCFPTRKRVPYRIILETIDIEQVKKYHIGQAYSVFKMQKPIPDKQRDLFDQVKQQVQKFFKTKDELQKKDNKYPFVIDQQQFKNMKELNKYAKKVENQQKVFPAQKMRETNSRRLGITRKDTMFSYKSRPRSSKKDEIYLFRNNKLQIANTQKLRIHDAVYIPTIPSNLRKSNQEYPKGIWIATDNENFTKRLSLRIPQNQDSDKKQKSKIKIINQQTRYQANISNTGKAVWKQPWSKTVQELRQTSPWKNLNSLRYRNMVIKGGDDLRQQIICMQLIYKMQSIIKDANCPVFIKPYQIIVLSENSGMLQFVSNSISIDGMKKQMEMSLPIFYQQVFDTQQRFFAAKSNFIYSLAGSSILTYILKLKDRHNGNILLDMQGNIIHIDFGFILGMSPGGINFQSSPFKFTEQYVLLLGGKDSPDYSQFVNLFCDGMSAIRKRCSQLCLILQIMMQDSDLECFQGFRIQSFRQRFQQKLTENQFRQFCQNLVQRSCMNSRTVHYDSFQKITNGIMP